MTISGWGWNDGLRLVFVCSLSLVFREGSRFWVVSVSGCCVSYWVAFCEVRFAYCSGLIFIVFQCWCLFLGSGDDEVGR